LKLEIHNYFQDTTPDAKFKGAMSTWAVWANSFTHESLYEYTIRTIIRHRWYSYSLTTYGSIANTSNYCTRSHQDPMMWPILR